MSDAVGGPLPLVGAFPEDSAITRFTVWAPLQPSMKVRFSDAQRAETMRACDDGYHELTTRAPIGTRYQYELADGRLRADPASLAQPEGVQGPSVVTARPSTTASFVCPPLEQHVIYELHVGTFTPEGTFDAIVPRLAALRTLGITAIELMPIAQFPGARNWGYDGVLPFAAQSSYGGLRGLRRLIDACHDEGLAIFLDVVYNHLGPEGNFLADFGPYFTDRYRTPWGAALNFDGADSDHVREYFMQSSLHWTRDCGADGLRLDAVHAIIDHSASPFVEELATRNHLEAERAGRRVVIVAESSDNDPRLVRDRAAGGIGLDGCWNDDYHHAVRTALTDDRRGYYASFGDAAQIAKALRDRYVFTGEHSSVFRRRHGARADDVAHGKFVVFTQNHDHVGNRPLGDRLDRSVGHDGARAAAALVLLSPFTPLLWMGEEYADAAPFQYFVSHSDAELIDAVRHGRRREFADFDEAGDVPDPQAPETFERSKLDWSARDRSGHAQMLAYYAELLRLRRAWNLPARSAAIASGARGSLVWLRYEGEPALAVVANVGDATASLALDEVSPKALTLIVDSGDARWGGDGSATIRGSARIDLKRKTALVLAGERSS